MKETGVNGEERMEGVEKGEERAEKGEERAENENRERT